MAKEYTNCGTGYCWYVLMQGFFSRLTSSFASYFRGENDANTNDVEEEIDNVELENPSATSHVAPDVQLEDKSTSTEVQEFCLFFFLFLKIFGIEERNV